MSAGVHKSEADAARKLSGGADKRVGVIEIGFNLANSEGDNIPSRHEGEPEFKFLARDTIRRYTESHPLLVASRPKLRKHREHKAACLVAGQEVSYSNGEITLNCTPLA